MIQIPADLAKLYTSFMEQKGVELTSIDINRLLWPIDYFLSVPSKGSSFRRQTLLTEDTYFSLREGNGNTSSL